MATIWMIRSSPKTKGDCGTRTYGEIRDEYILPQDGGQLLNLPLTWVRTQSLLGREYAYYKIVKRSPLNAMLGVEGLCMVVVG